MLRVSLLGVLLLAGCHPGVRSSGPARDGFVAVAWSGGGPSAKFSGPATGRWCAADSLLEVLVERNDTAVGFVLVTLDSLRTGDYPVYRSKVFLPWRPQASAALRLINGTELRAYESIGGKVTVTQGGSRRVSASFDVELQHAAGGSDSLHLTGSFTGLAIGPASGLCGRANKQPAR